MKLEIKIVRTIGGQDCGTLTVHLAGSLDTATAPELERQLATAMIVPVKNVIFNLAQLKFLSSAGIRVFSTTRKTLLERGGQTSFVNLQPQIELVFETIKALPGIAVFQDEAKLDSYLALLQRNHPASR
jgi:anti-sigma B factor antagonist